jgi:hypothetical protein
MIIELMGIGIQEPQWKLNGQSQSLASKYFDGFRSPNNPNYAIFYGSCWKANRGLLDPLELP